MFKYSENDDRLLEVFGIRGRLRRTHGRRKISLMNEVVKKISQLEITGNVLPVNWLQHLKHKNGKPHVVAAILLSDLVYWHKAKVVRDEHTGQIKGRKKRFKGDRFQRQYKQYAETFGFTERQVRDAMTYLVNEGIVEREVRTVTLESGARLPNRTFFTPVPEKIRSITYDNLVDLEDEAPEEEDEAPQSQEDKDSEARMSVYQAYESNITANIAPTVGEKMYAWMEDSCFNENAAMIIHAINIAAENNVRKWSYVESILRGWSEKGIRTLEQAKHQSKEHNRTAKKKNQNSKNRTEEDISEEEKFWL